MFAADRPFGFRPSWSRPFTSMTGTRITIVAISIGIMKCPSEARKCRQPPLTPRARPAAAVPAGELARGRRCLCPCHRVAAGGGRRHARLCRPLRSRGIRSGAGARGAAADGAARALRRPRRARRCTRRARAAGEADHLRLARRGPGRRRAGRRGAPRLAAGRRRGRAAGVARVRRHDPHRGHGRGRARACDRSRRRSRRKVSTISAPAALVESFARHLMVAVDAWQEKGFGEIAKNYLARLTPENGRAPRDRRRRRRPPSARCRGWTRRSASPPAPGGWSRTPSTAEMPLAAQSRCRR